MAAMASGSVAMNRANWTPGTTRAPGRLQGGGGGGGRPWLPGTGDRGCGTTVLVKRYTERVKTNSDHQQEIRRAYGLRDFAGAKAELARWVAGRAWTSGDGLKAISSTRWHGYVSGRCLLGLPMPGHIR